MTLLALLLAFVTTAPAQIPAAGLTRIGAAAAVKGVVMAQAPNAAVGRVMESGKPLFLNDHVTTDAAGRLQVMLLDETVFTVGANSDMVLDEFVYDPATSAGKVTARVTKGVFRFVTGKVARKDPASMKVKLPVGTIGIRGTIAGGQVSENGSIVVLFGPGGQNNADENPGSVTVYNEDGEVVITQSGFGTTIAPGQPPAGVTDLSQQAQQILNALDPTPPQGAGSGHLWDDALPGQQSGQDTAAGGGNAGSAEVVGDFSGSQNNLQTWASQTGSGIADGLSSWEQVTNAQSGLLGTYSGTGDYSYCSCTGGSCGSGTTVPDGMNFNISVDFGARAITSGSVSIASMPSIGNTSTSIAYGASGPNQIPFGSSGPASIPLSAGNSVGDSGFYSHPDGPTTLSFMNRGGVAAQDMKVDLKYVTSFSGSSYQATGSAIAPFTPAPAFSGSSIVN